MGFDDFLNTYNNPQDAMNDFLSPTIDNYNSTNYMSSKIGSSSNTIPSGYELKPNQPTTRREAFKGTAFDPMASSKQVPNLDSQNRNVGMNAKEIVAKNLNAGALTNPSSTSYSTNNVPAPSVADTNILPQATGALPEAMEGQSPIGTTSAVADASPFMDKVSVGNVIGGASMIASNIGASQKLDSAISDIDEGLSNITGMMNTQNRENRDTIKTLNLESRNQIEQSADTANLRLGNTLEKVNRSNISTGSIKNISNQIREKLSKNLDTVSENVINKTNMAIDKAHSSNRTAIEKINVFQEQLLAKRRQLQKDKKDAKIGALVGGASILSDILLPGSGQVIRGGYNAYSRYS